MYNVFRKCTVGRSERIIGEKSISVEWRWAYKNIKEAYDNLMENALQFIFKCVIVYIFVLQFYDRRYIYIESANIDGYMK